MPAAKLKIKMFAISKLGIKYILAIHLKQANEQTLYVNSLITK